MIHFPCNHSLLPIRAIAHEGMDRCPFPFLSHSINDWLERCTEGGVLAGMELQLQLKLFLQYPQLVSQILSMAWKQYIFKSL